MLQRKYIMADEARKIVTKNRKVRHDYEILDTLEAGIMLTGTEVKAVREGKASIKEAHAEINRGEMWLVDCNISPYSHGNIFNHEPLRKRKLLMHSREIERWRKKVEEKGLTIVPYSLYFKRGRLKVELCLVRGRRKYDKRQALKEQDVKRSLRRGDDY